MLAPSTGLHLALLGVPVAARLPWKQPCPDRGQQASNFLEMCSGETTSTEYIIPGLEGSCAATAGCCENTGCASAGRPKPHSRPKSVACAGPGCTV